MHSKFYLTRELLPLDQWNRADYYTKQVFSWLCDLKLGRAFGLFGLDLIHETLVDSFPKGYDTYIITPGTEYVDWQWLNSFCKRVPDSQVIIVGPYTHTLFAEPNLRIITFDVWPYNLKFYLDEYQQTDVNYLNRNYKISSLANRVSQFRSYINAYLHKTWNEQDYIMSWRKVVGKQEDLYLLNNTGNDKIDHLIDYLRTNLWDLTIKPDETFLNRPLNNLDYNWSAYTDCVINCSNESVNNSYQCADGIEHIQPGPFLTEKTYKTLLSGTALLAVGQYQTYSYLESQGFQFDYPWDRSYDNIPGDIDRIAKVIDTLESIKKISCEDCNQLTLKSRQYNREHIFSGDYYQTVNTQNYHNIELFSKTL